MATPCNIFEYGGCTPPAFCGDFRRKGGDIPVGSKKCAGFSEVREQVPETGAQKFFSLNIQMAKTRRSRGKKGTRKLSSWNMLVMKTFKELKAKNKNASFSDALKEASKRKK